MAANQLDEAPGTYLTVAQMADGTVKTFPETHASNRQISFGILNLSPQTIDIRTSQGDISIFEGVAPETFADRSGNPLALAIKIESAAASLDEVSLNLARGTRPLILISTKWRCSSGYDPPPQVN